MSVHLFAGVMWVGFAPKADPGFLPKGMLRNTWYRVFAYENGSLKLKDGGKGEALFFHVVDEKNQPFRILHSNAVVSCSEVPKPFPIVDSSDDFPG